MRYLITVVRFAMLGTLLCAAVLLPACSAYQAQNTQLMKQWTAKCKEAADLLETIKDVPSAKAAEPKLKEVIEAWRKIDEKLQAYDPEEVEDSPRMTRHAAEGIGEFQRLMVESLRISKNPELRSALGETWKSLPAAAMMDAQGNFPPTE